jgi:hypothetical protein
MKKAFVSITILIGIVIILAITSGCANIIPPLGGPKDTLAPVLVSSTPKDSTLNFRGKNITLTFDEYIDLDDVQNNLLFTPLFDNVPEVSVKLKTINVRLRDTLEPNTTYTFNFGNAIKDMNEGNPFRQFTYTFSTGSYLDSLKLSGQVILAENGKIDSTLTIVLHTDLSDSAVVKNRPRYATRLDSSGRFTFINLPRDTFAIYALGEAGTLRRYTSPQQYFAFSDSTIISGSTSNILLYAYKEEEEEKKAVRTIPTGRGNADKRLRLTNSLGNNEQDLLSDLVFTSERPLRNFDSTRIRLTRDSGYVPVTNYTLALDSTQKELRLQTKWAENVQYHLIFDKEFAEDTTGRKLLRNDTVSFKTKALKEYGSIDIKLRNVDLTKNPVLQFLQSDKLMFSVPVKSGAFTQQLFLPGEYELRILYDRNNNGLWDPGDFFKGRKQPELVFPIQSKISVKPDWENQFDRSL